MSPFFDGLVTEEAKEASLQFSGLPPSFVKSPKTQVRAYFSPLAFRCSSRLDTRWTRDETSKRCESSAPLSNNAFGLVCLTFRPRLRQSRPGRRGSGRRGSDARGVLMRPARSTRRPTTLGLGRVSCPMATSSPSNVPLQRTDAVSYTHLRAHETKANLVCRLLLEKK